GVPSLHVHGQPRAPRSVVVGAPGRAARAAPLRPLLAARAAARHPEQRRQAVLGGGAGGSAAYHEWRLWFAFRRRRCERLRSSRESSTSAVVRVFLREVVAATSGTRLMRPKDSSTSPAPQSSRAVSACRTAASTRRRIASESRSRRPSSGGSDVAAFS